MPTEKRKLINWLALPANLMDKFGSTPKELHTLFTMDGIKYGRGAEKNSFDSSGVGIDVG